MIHNFHFDSRMMASMVGGLSVMDRKRLNIQSLDQAKDFIRAYGFEPDNELDLSKLWSYHRRAVTFIQSELFVEGESFPEILSDPNQLKDIAFLLIYASTKDSREKSLKSWACAILKVMHVLVHLDNDLFTEFSSEIQDQILKPIQSEIYSDAVMGTSLGAASSLEMIPLKKFSVKPFKTSDSSVTKLLAKPNEVAFSVLDKIGVRFITKHLFDSFRVIRFLANHHLVSFPHNVPDQSNNTLYPINIFLEVMESFTRDQKMSADEVDRVLRERLSSSLERAQYKVKLNQFSSENYRFIKFITRRLVRVEIERAGKPRTLSFFYPFEVQILDYETYLENLSGPASHEEYKKRQKRRARARVLGLGIEG